MFKLDLKTNGRSISNSSQFEREFRKAALQSAQADVQRKIQSTGARGRIIERGGKVEIELTGSDEAVEKAKKWLTR